MSLLKMLALAPCKHSVQGERSAVLNDLFLFLALLLIDIIAYKHVQCTGPTRKIFQCFQHAEIGILLYPVVAVHNLEVKPAGVIDPGVDSRTVPSVRLVNRLDDARILCLVLVRNLRSPVPCRSVIHNNDLDIVPSHKKGVDALAHICL